MREVNWLRNVKLRAKALGAFILIISCFISIPCPTAAEEGVAQSFDFSVSPVLFGSSVESWYIDSYTLSSPYHIDDRGLSSAKETIQHLHYTKYFLYMEIFIGFSCIGLLFYETRKRSF